MQLTIFVERVNEQTYGAGHHAQVVMKYRVNGRQEQQWQWPPR